MIGKLLAHPQVRTAARYAHLTEDAVKASAERVAASLVQDLTAIRISGPESFYWFETCG